MVSWLFHGRFDAYVPGIMDLLHGYTDEHGVYHSGAKDRIPSGRIAIQALKDYREYRANGDEASASVALALFKEHEKDMGFGYFSEDHLGELVPHVPFLFWAFRYMVAL